MRYLPSIWRRPKSHDFDNKTAFARVIRVPKSRVALLCKSLGAAGTRNSELVLNAMEAVFETIVARKFLVLRTQLAWTASCDTRSRFLVSCRTCSRLLGIVHDGLAR